MTITRPLRILVVVSRPIAEELEIEHGGRTYQAISPVSWPPVQVVRDGLRKVFRDEAIPVAVRFLPHATLADLQRALPEGYDVLHFVGHGAEDGALLMENEDGTADLVAPDVLGEALRETEVRLALLSACHSGAAGRTLQAAGIPDVVMVDEEWPMEARAAALFNGQFYACLARGMCPSAAYRAGLRAVRTDARFGDRAAPPANPETGEEEPRYGERFAGSFDADGPLVARGIEGKYQELHPLEAPCTVPADEVFVGRELERIETIWGLQGCRWVTLVGPGGIGKTAVARQVARWQHERNHFPDGVLAVDAAGCQSADDLATGFTAALSDPRLRSEFRLDPRHPWASIGVALAGCWLVLLDNAEELRPEAVQALNGLLGQVEELHLLVTSRQRLGAVGREEAVEIEQMPVGRDVRVAGPAEQTFLAYVPGERRAEVREEHFPAVQTLCREVGGYPLGLVLTASQLADEKETVEGVLERVRAAMPEALSYARAANLPARHRSVGAALKSSFDRLSGEARVLVAHVAQFPGGAAEATLAVLEPPFIPPTGERGWEEVAGELRHSWLVRWADGRYTMLPPIRAVAAGLLPEGERAAYRLRAAGYFRDYARLWQQGLDTAGMTQALRADMDELRPQLLAQLPLEVRAQVTDEQLVELVISMGVAQARAALETERANVSAAIAWAAEAGEHGLVLELVDAVYVWLNQAGYWREAVEHGRLALAAARQAGDGRAIGQWAHNLAVTLDGLGEKAEAEALYAEAEQALGAPEHRKEMAVVLHQQGMLAQSRGDYEGALSLYRRSLEIREQLGDRAGAANSYGQIGTLLQAQGQWNEALESYKQALAIFEQLGDRAGVAYTMGNIGYVHHARGDWQEALEAFEQVRRISEDMGDKPSVAKALHAIGMVHQARGDYEAALGLYRRSLEIKEQLGDRVGAASSLHQIGRVHQARGDYDVALGYYRRSLEMAEQLGDRAGAAQSLGQIGQVAQLQGDYVTAVRLWAQALATFEALGMPERDIVLGWFARLREELGAERFEALLREARLG